MDLSSPPSLAILRFAAAQVAAEAAAVRLAEQAEAAVLASRARAASGAGVSSSASAFTFSTAAARSSTPTALPPPPTPARRRGSGGSVTPGTRQGRRRTSGAQVTGATAAALAAAVEEVREGSAGARAPAPLPTSPAGLAAAVVSDRRAALAAASAAAAPPAIPATSWPYPASLPPGSAARLTPWPALRAPLPARPLPSFPASDGRRAGRAEPLWWPPPGSGARLLSKPTLTGAARLSGSGGGGQAPPAAGAPAGAPLTSGRAPQHAAETALASSRLYELPSDAIAPSPAPLPRPPPGWAGPAFVVRRSGVAGLGLYILVPAPQGAYLCDYSGTVVRGGGVADARERAYTSTGGGWCEAGGTYMFDCGPAVWGGGAAGGRVGAALSVGAAAFLAHAAAHGPAGPPPPRGASAARGAPPTLVVDATQAGSAARFINHSCAPNCVAIVEPPATAWGGWLGGLSGDATAAPGAARGGAAVAAGLPRVSLYAARALRPGEELFFEYRLSPPEPGDPTLVCGCGAAGCRGVL